MSRIFGGAGKPADPDGRVKDVDQVVDDEARLLVVERPAARWLPWWTAAAALALVVGGRRGFGRGSRR